jgi:hypothetical protein
VPRVEAVKDAGRSVFACGGAMRRGFDGEQKRDWQTAAKISADVDVTQSGMGWMIPSPMRLPDSVTTTRCVARKTESTAAFPATTQNSTAQSNSPPTACQQTPNMPTSPFNYTPMSPVSLFLRDRHKTAIADFDAEWHHQALYELSGLPIENPLPDSLRIGACAILVRGIDDYFLAEQYRLSAERAYNRMRAMVPNSEGGPESRPNVDHEHMLLDWLADIQSWRAMDPRRDILASVTAGVQDMTLEDSDISAALCRFLTWN